jgi:hypothetical protein
LKIKLFSLENLPGVQDVCLSEHQPCDNIAITSWEQRYSTILPQKIKDFYLVNFFKQQTNKWEISIKINK